ncbi:MAG: hypothetical protein ABI725_01230 [Chloroflexota bacterium]
MGYTASTCFDELLAGLRLTPTQKDIAAGRVAHLKTFFPTAFAMARDVWATGSYARDTLISWRRDVDVMAIVSDDYWPTYQFDSSKFLYRVRDRLNDEYRNTKVSSQEISVRIAAGEDIEVDVVPGFERDDGGFLIPNGSGRWMATNPPAHFEKVRELNVQLDSRFKPLVRIMKAWNEANARPISSIHVELLVYAIWHGESLVPSWPEAVDKTLLLMPIWLKEPLPDIWAPGGMVDRGLSSDQRAKSLRMVDSDYDKAAEALRLERDRKYREANEAWQVVFRRKFPAYG